MVEVYTTDRKDNTVWQPRPADPELEAEFLRRLMVKLGVSQEQAKATIAAGAKPPVARVETVDGMPAVVIDENFDRAWRRVGLSLDRSGFTVEDRNRAEGIYFVRYVPPDEGSTRKEPGFLGRIIGWFSRSDSSTSAPARYRIRVATSGERSTVTVLDANGQPDRSPVAQRIVQLLAADMK